MEKKVFDPGRPVGAQLLKYMGGMAYIQRNRGPRREPGWTPGAPWVLRRAASVDHSSDSAGLAADRKTKQ